MATTSLIPGVSTASRGLASPSVGSVASARAPAQTQTPQEIDRPTPGSSSVLYLQLRKRCQVFSSATAMSPNGSSVSGPSGN